MIEKKIYYCWFGNGEMSDLNKKCVESWYKQCPDYEIIKINETNYDVNSHPYAKAGYEHGNWSYVTDAVRLEILKHNSGFYLDTDVLLLKSLDELRIYDKGFITEFEAGQPDSGVLGCGTYPKLYEDAYAGLLPGTVLHKQFIQRLYERYDIHGQKQETFDDGFTVINEEVFPTVRTGLITENTIGIHYFENTWTRGWTNLTDPFYPYTKVKVYLGNRLIHEDEGAVVIMKCKNAFKKWNDAEMLGRMNYFFNPRVVKLITPYFEAERIDYDRLAPLKATITISGMVVYTIMEDKNNGVKSQESNRYFDFTD